jgi:hypothetical protein
LANADNQHLIGGVPLVKETLFFLLAREGAF